MAGWNELLIIVIVIAVLWAGYRLGKKRAKPVVRKPEQPDSLDLQRDPVTGEWRVPEANDPGKRQGGA